MSEAESRLGDLIRRAEAGDEIILTRDGRPAVRLMPARAVPTGEARRAILDAALGSGTASAHPGPPAARSQDFLYDEDGLPR